MQNGLKSNSLTSSASRKRRIAIAIAGLLILLGIISIAVIKTSVGNREPPTVIMRVDDIQDFAFREAQFFLLNESMINQVPLSIAIIPGFFGKDSEAVQTVKLAVSLGSDVAAHGWQHEDFAQLSFSEQVALLHQSKSKIKEVLDYDAKVFVPPMFSFNEDTIVAMQEEGYNIISTCTDFDKPGLLSQVISLPATIELSHFSNGTWNMKSLDSIKGELSRSIKKYGFAIIVTHPQEFILDGKLNQVNTELYRILLRSLKRNYSFKTLERLRDIYMTSPG